MNREGAETYLQLLAGAKRGGAVGHVADRPRRSPPGGGRMGIMLVAEALTAVGALGTETVDDILADFDLALGVRQLHDQPGTGPGMARSMPYRIAPPGTMHAAAVARWAAQVQARRSGPTVRAGRLALAEPANPEPSVASGADRFVPVGLTVPFYDEGISGHMYIMSFVQPSPGARFIAVWRLNSTPPALPPPPPLPTPLPPDLPPPTHAPA